MKKNNPGCCGCGCIEWTGTPPDQLTLTFPADCATLVGPWTLDLGVGATSDCPTQDFPIDHVCYTWGYEDPTMGSEGTTILVQVGNSNGVPVVLAGACGDCPSGGFSINAGSIFEYSNPPIDDYSELDGLSVPHTDSVNCSQPADCTEPADDVLIEIPP